MKSFFKDPGATLDYSVDWSALLSEGEAIAASSWAVASSEPTDITLVIGVDDYASTFDDTSTTVWLSEGLAGVRYVVTNTVTTDSTPPRTDERSFALEVRDL